MCIELYVCLVGLRVFGWTCACLRLSIYNGCVCVYIVMRVLVCVFS